MTAATKKDIITMSRRAAIFRQSDLQRALRAVRAAGLTVERIEVEPCGKLHIVTRSGADGQQADTLLDRWLASHARAS